MDNSFVKAPLQVPHLSGFDKSHQNLLTTKVGTITPILVDELIPGSKVNLRVALSGSLPPLASETFMRCSVKTEAFFVPMRLLSGSFENFFTDNPKRFWHGTDPVDVKAALPRIQTNNDSAAVSIGAKMGNGSLADYLGFRSGGDAAALFVRNVDGVSLMPFLAYHKIFSDWYRNTLVQRDIFLPKNDAYETSPSDDSVAQCPYIYSDAAGEVAPRNFMTLDSLNLADGVSVLSLRQRNFGLDYFTTATPQPQQGDPAKVSFRTDAATGEFSIAALRASNSLQQFKERNNLLGDFYVDHLRGRYGVRPSDAIAQRAILLGSGEFEVYSKGVYQTAGFTNETQGTNNPFDGSVGARFGSAYASGSDFVVNCEATESGYLFVMATLVPRVTYSSGVDPMLLRYTRDGSISQMANPILQNVGPEPIYAYELTGAPNGQIFGYTDRYASFKTKQDTLHGLLRDGQSLQSFALQRSFEPSASVQISSDFLQIPTDYLDQVSAVTGSISQYGCWLDCYFDYKVAMPLSKYSLPSLQDPAYEHGKVVVVNKGGTKL